MPATRLTYLMNRHFENKTTEDENNELMALLTNTDNEEEVITIMNHAWEDNQFEKTIFTTEKSDKILSAIVEIQSHYAHKNTIKHRKWIYAVAAVVLLFVSISIFIFRNNKPIDGINQVVEIANTTITQKPLYKNDVKPGGNKAILTLADGTKIVLDDASKGTLTRQGKTTIIKLDSGRLAYNVQPVSNIPLKAMLYNTLTTPRGGQYCVTLPDGTVVWLNAASSLRFPTAFTGHERRVEIKGEAYFEVSKNAAMPFIVEAGNEEIKVLGTHFNVMAYSDDKVIKTTLIEGQVEVSLTNTRNSATESKSIILEPGQQSQLNRDNGLTVVAADLKEAVAWKNGYFIFTNENIESIMLKISRWYDVKVKLEVDPLNRNFTGNISRAQNVSEVLNMLELTDEIHFKIEGKSITVLP